MSLSLRVIFNEKKFNKKMKFKSESKGSEVKEMIGKKITKNFDTKNYHLFIPHEKEGEFIPGEWIKETETLSSYGLINGSIIELKTFLIKIRVKTLSNTENILDINLQENVSNVISQIHKELSLPNPIEYYSLAKCGEFEYETKVLEKSKTLFEQDVCDGSAIIKCVESFYFEKFDQSFNEGDALTTRFECFRKNILSGNHLVGLDDALNFAALEMQIQIGNHDEKKHKPSFIKPKLYLSPLWVLVEGIEKDLIHAHSLIVGMSEKVAKERFVFHVYATKPFSTNFYNTKELVSKKKYKPFVVGITPEALIKYTEDRKTILSIIKIIDIKRFATTINSITFHYLNRAEKFQSFQFFCDQIMEIEELVKNYLSAAVKKKKANLLIQKQIDSQGKTESEYKPSQNKSHKLITESSKYQLEKLKESQNEVIQQSDIGFTNTQINQEILHSTQQLQDISFVSKSNITTRRDRDEFMTSNINEENQNSQPTDYSTISNDLDMSQLLSQKIDSNDLNAFISSKPNTSGNQFQSDYGISKPEQAFMSGNFQSEFETSNIENLMSTNYSEFTSQFGVADPQQISSPNLTTQQETTPNPQFIPQLPHDFSPHNKFDPSPLDFSTQSIEDLLKSDLTTMNQNQNQNQSNQTLQFMKTKIQSDLEKANSQTDIQQDPRLTTTALNSFLNTNYLNTTRINPIELNSTIMRSANFVKSFSIFVQIPESNEQSVHIGNVSTFIVNNSVNNLPQEINIREFLSKDSKFQIPNEYIVLNELANNTFIAFTKSQSKLQPNFENYKTRLSFLNNLTINFTETISKIMVDFPKLLLPDLRQFKENVHTITSKLKSINNEIQKLAMATLCEDLEMIMFKKQHPETIKGQNQVQTFTPLSNKITKIFGGVNKIITDLIVSIVQSGNTPSNLSNYGSALSRLFITTVQTCKSIIENAQITKKEFDIIPIPNQQTLNSLSNQFYQVSEILCKVYGSEIFDSYSTFSIPNSETLITIMNNFQEISNFWDIISENVINSNKNNTSFSSEILANLQQIQNKIIFIKENKAKIVETDNPNITILSELIGKLISLLTNIESSESDSKSKSKSPSNSFSTGTTHQFIIESANSLILQFSKITTEMKTKSINTKLVEDSNPIINQFNQILQLLTGNSQLFYSNTNYLTAFQSSLNQIYQIIKQLKPISESFETNIQESISSIFKLINLIQLLIFKQSHIIIRTSIQKFSENFISLFKSSNQAITGFGEEQKQKFSIFAQEAHLSLKNIANLTQLKDSKSLNNIDELVLKPLTLLLSKIIPFYNYVKELSVSVSDLDSQLNLLSSLSNFNNQFQNFKSLIETLIKLFSNKII